jgi:hypothetical protein
MWRPLWPTRRRVWHPRAMRVLLLSHADASSMVAAALLARGHDVTLFGAGAVHGALLDALDGHDGCLLLGQAPEFATLAATVRDRGKAVWRAWTDVPPVAALPPRWMD